MVILAPLIFRTLMLCNAEPIWPGSTLNGTYAPFIPIRFSTVENMTGDFERMTRSSPNMQYTCIQKPSLLDRTNLAKETSRS
jgi:hypothetical protein